MKLCKIVFGSFSGIQKHAVEALSKTLMDYTGVYPVCISAKEYSPKENERCFFVGTRANNPYLAAREEAHLTRPEEYRILVENDTVFLEGFDDGGVLYGCLDFYNRYLIKAECTHDSGNYFINPLEEGLSDFVLTSAPSVERRGIWTWGHVICDYRGFMENLAALKMNTVIIWNDHVPVNAEDIVACAHEWNVKVYWGFAWLWDTDCAKFDMTSLEAYSEKIAAFYEETYASLCGDGIYFQSFTELNRETIGGVLIAEAVTGFVNRTASRILEKNPELELQFGLHAESVRERLACIQKVDPRVRIVWENCGSFPFSYIPHDVEKFDETVAFARRIANLRGAEERFSVVLKGFTKLDWSRFEHPAGPQVIGVTSGVTQQHRTLRKRKIWRYVQAYRLAHDDKALEMIRCLRDETNGALHITALVEDGMFETQRIYSVVLFAEMLWDSESDYKELVSRVALRDDVEFA